MERSDVTECRACTPSPSLVGSVLRCGDSMPAGVRVLREEDRMQIMIA